MSAHACPHCGEAIRVEVLAEEAPVLGMDQLTLDAATLRAVAPPEDWSADERALLALLAACRRLGVTLDQLRSRDRNPTLDRIRHGAMWLARNRGASLSAIGRVLDRDHSTVSHGIAAHERRRAA